MFLIENVRKMMGWCPNVAAMDTKKIQFDDLAVNASDKGGESNHTTMKWGNKYHNLILIGAILATIGPINMLVSWGVMSTGSLFSGAFSGLLTGVVMRKSVWHSLDRIETRKPRKTTSRVSIKKAIVFAIGFLLYVIALSHLIAIFGSMNIVAFHGGFGMSLFWSVYIQVIQWEGKNQKILVKFGFADPVAVVLDRRKAN
ncbi:DUF1673 domain-containing protein [Methanolobus vulcani]|uniref:DUF1673 domain-containing protein n=1 Tax=Methanolobus vulcani TaxID=38026 RepID=A0A7Z8KMM1_9EURY|nr:DUF1673 domain-containing protein [Methanolobus vulcani]TQD24907.1 DUF1673 domain-containing protein [Methanolobus vulcani]